MLEIFSGRMTTEVVEQREPQDTGVRGRGCLGVEVGEKPGLADCKRDEKRT